LDDLSRGELGSTIPLVRNDARMERVKVLGIVGGIGSGKSTIGAFFAARGAVVLDADVAAHAALDDPSIRAAIVARFGSVTAPDGSIDRAKLAKRVFSDGTELAALERIVHPAVLANLSQRLRAAQTDPSSPLVVLDAPLLLETGLDRECDAVAFIDAPLEVRTRRVAENRGWSPEELAAREARQLPVAEKRARANYVIDNSGSRDRAERDVHTVFSELTRNQPIPPRRGGADTL
jgi:dephospho-CoA kinase